MSDIGELALRMVVSLGVVLVLVAAAYFVARRRQQGLTMVGPARRRSRPTSASTLTIEGRAGLARGSAAVAVRFADRIVLVGVSDGAPSSVLADVSAEEWDRELDVVDSMVAPTRTPLAPNDVISPRPSFLNALRDATSRSA